MEEYLVDGVLIKDDENLIIIPTGYLDSIITREHFAQKGEAIVTCNMLVDDLMNKINKFVICPDCGKGFKVVRYEDVCIKVKPEAPKVEAPKVEAPKVEAPKVEAPKVEAPKVEAPKKTKRKPRIKKTI